MGGAGAAIACRIGVAWAENFAVFTVNMKFQCFRRKILAVLSALLPPLLSSTALAADCVPNSHSKDVPQEILARLKCLDDRIAALEGTGPAWKVAAARAKSALQAQEAGNIRIEVDSCSKSNGNIECDIYITSDEDKDVEFKGDSRLVDENGLTFYWLGYQTPGQRMDTGNVRRYFISETRTRATIFFRAGDLTPADKLSAVQLQFSTAHEGAIKGYALTIRNVPLKGEREPNRIEAAARSPQPPGAR